MKDRGWVEACDLKVGDELSTTDNRWIPIDHIHRDGSVATVYNMTVRNWHTYFVGEPSWGFDVWVHNNHGNAYRALSADDMNLLDAGQKIQPKSNSGSILDHIQGYDTKYISVSRTEGGVTRFIREGDVIVIDLDILKQTGSGIVPHEQLVQVARSSGRVRDLENVLTSQEMLITNGIDPTAITRRIR